MAYQRKTWSDRQSEYPNRRKLSPVADAENVFAVEREEGLVMEEGDRFDQATMNALEGRVEDAFGELTSGTTKVAKAVEADNATKAYGKTEGALSVSYAASAGSAAACTGSAATCTGNAATATRATTAVTADNATKAYGKAESALSVTYATGAGNADTVDGYHVWTGTKAQYNAISSKSAVTFYFIVE